VPGRRTSRRLRRFGFTLFTAFSLVLVIVSGFVIYDHFTAGVATAEIIGVRHERKYLYTVSFVTADGRQCEAVLSAGESVELGDRVLIRHSQNCLNVWRPGDDSWVMFPVVGLIFLSFGAVGAYLAWFRTEPDGKIHWRLPAQ
jgi:hypothetical protein